jgi:DNA-binding Lrp family transcriptional regulator
VVDAYVLIQTRVGMGPRVVRELALTQGVISAEGVTGPYDAIACIQAATLDELGRLVATHIQAVEGITRTITCLRTQST